MNELTMFDDWLKDRGPAALVIRENLVPVEGPQGVFFPATYAPQLGADRDRTKFQGGYNVDVFDDKTNVCIVDSVGSQANRIEPIFAESEFCTLVPQIVVTFPEKNLRLNLLHANHRAADAIIRCSAFEQELRKAFQEVLRGNAEPLAKIAPTSIVFGVWDSRDTSAKLPRLLASTIRAFNVKVHTRSANFLTQQTLDLAKLEILPDAESKDGFANALASKTHGGVQAAGGIRRDAILSLAALRRLTVLDENGAVSAERTAKLRRYILGLSLVALTAPQDSYLRQGCNLVPDIEKPREFSVVHADGSKNDAKITFDVAIRFASAACDAFGIGKDQEMPFDKKLAEGAAQREIEKVKGEVLFSDAGEKKFKMRSGKRNDPKEIDVATSESTTFTKGDDESTFADTVVAGAKLEVEIANGIAVRVKSKR